MGGSKFLQGLRVLWIPAGGYYFPSSRNQFLCECETDSPI
jgi:hypothetical protein